MRCYKPGTVLGVLLIWSFQQQSCYYSILEMRKLRCQDTRPISGRVWIWTPGGLAVQSLCTWPLCYAASLEQGTSGAKIIALPSFSLPIGHWPHACPCSCLEVLSLPPEWDILSAQARPLEPAHPGSSFFSLWSSGLNPVTSWDGTPCRYLVNIYWLASPFLRKNTHSHIIYVSGIGVVFT